MRDTMHDLNLVLKFQLAGETQFQIRGASRITVDGRGGLMFYDAQSGASERIDMGRLQSFSLLNTMAPTVSTLPN
jgi:hypothetical protein